MPSALSSRDTRRLIIVEFNPYQILVAEISRPSRGNACIEATAEFARKDHAGLRAWIESRDYGRKTRTAVLCGLVPTRGVVQRETVLPARLAEPGYLDGLIHEHQKSRFLTATPFKIFKDAAWTFRTVNAVDGSVLPADDNTHPALICALASEEVLEAQERLADRRLVRERLEPGLFSLFGALYQNLERRDDLRAVVVLLVLERVTAVYILGKEGVHTPSPVMQGLHSIIEIGRKELGGNDDAEILAQLQDGAPPAPARAAKLVGRIGRDLKPVIDSFEMTTGQPVDEIFCAYLPPGLAWIATSLAETTGRTSFTLDSHEWLPTARLALAEGLPPVGPHWIGALALASNLPDVAPSRLKRSTGGNPVYQRPWHVDSSVPTEEDDREFAGRRFLVAAGAAALAALALVVTAWQVYATHSLRTNTAFWERQIVSNQKLFTELTTAGVALRTQSAIVDRAYELMVEPYQLSELLLSFGRSIPPHMRVDRIETNDSRVALAGALLEPAEEASATLGRYIDDLRRNPKIGPLFAHIGITTLQRKSNTDEMIFELTLRLNRPSP